MITRMEKDEKIQTLVLDKKLHLKSKVKVKLEDRVDFDKRIASINNQMKKVREEYKKSIKEGRNNNDKY